MANIEKRVELYINNGSTTSIGLQALFLELRKYWSISSQTLLLALVTIILLLAFEGLAH